MFRIAIGAAGLARPKTVLLDLADPRGEPPEPDAPETPPATPAAQAAVDPVTDPPDDDRAPDPRSRSTSSKHPARSRSPRRSRSSLG